MLKMRREWRRTSSSQAEPSPWRHCWTSWASCSNVSSASKPGTVTCATTSGQFLVKPQAALLGLPYYGTKSASEMFPDPTLGCQRCPHLTQPPRETQETPRRNEVRRLAPAASAVVILRTSDGMPTRPQLGPHCEPHIFAHSLFVLSRFDLTTKFVCNRRHEFPPRIVGRRDHHF